MIMSACSVAVSWLHARRPVLVTIIFTACLLGPARAFAQGQIDGRLSDLTGAPLPGVQVVLTPSASSTAVSTAQTDTNGAFAFQDVTPGTYVIRVVPAGFSPTERRVIVNASGRARVDIQSGLAVEEQVTVLGARSREGLALDVPSEGGSRLGLTSRELPASLEIIPHALMQQRGARTAGEAVESAVGVTVGDSPGNPANFSTRGFTNNQISVLHDGLKVGPPSMVGRPLDTWNLERVEVLKGPASALFGEGAVGAAVNYVSKRPDRGPQIAEGELTYGGFNTVRLGLGAGGPLGQRGLHYRADYSLNRSDGFIDRTPSTLHNLTSGFMWDATTTLKLQISFDALHDDISPYWGAPLVPASFATDPIDGIVETSTNETIDRRLRRVNYNVSDNVMNSTTYWTRAKGEWQAAPGLLVRNEFYYLNAERTWKNSETYAFNARTRLIDRDRFFVAHDQSIVGNRFEFHGERPIGGYANRFLAGIDISALDFFRPSFFADGDTVDPFSPTPGVFGTLVPANQTADIRTVAVFAEDYFAIRSNLKLAASMRAEGINLDRKLFTASGVLNAGPSFERDFTPVTGKVGVVYDVRPSASLYAHVASAADPVNTNLFIVRSGENFDLAHGVQMEVGAKQTLPRGLGEWTTAVYRIERKDILTQTSLTTADAVGQQSSSGIEATLVLRPRPKWTLQTNVAFVRARFDEFDERVGNQLVSRAGNRPFNVPPVVVGLWGSYRLGDRQPVEMGGAFRYVGDRFTTTDNAIRMLGYGVLDAFATWNAGRYRITARIRNLLDEDYAIWGDNFYPTQVLLGAPRSAEIGVGFRF